MKLNERPFMDPANEPAGQTIKTALGEMFICYKEITGEAGGFSQEWNFSKSSGWMLKVFDARKALFYLIPLNGGFKISMAIRENERETFLQDGELWMLQEKLASSKKYSEGFAMQFDISNRDDFQPAEQLIKKLITMRT